MVENKSRKHKIWNRFICALFVLVLAVGFMPINMMGVYADTTDPEEETNPVEELLTMDENVPVELKDEDSEYPNDVYGVDNEIIEDGEENTNMPFLLSEQNELGFIVTDLGAGKAKMYRFDNFNMNETEHQAEDGSLCWVDGINVANAESNSYMPESNTEIYDSMQHIQSIGVDRDGTGRKQYIASVGVIGSTLVLTVQNASTGRLTTEEVGAVTASVTGYEGQTYYWAAENYMAITAGDYDGDGKDSIILYYCGDGDEASLVE